MSSAGSRLARALIRVYPADWRARHGDELAAILEQRPPRPTDVVDLLQGALDAHHRAHTARTQCAREPSVVTRIRTMHPAVLLFMAIMALGLAYAIVVSIVVASAPNPERWVGWGPIGLATGATIVLVGLATSFRWPIAGLVAGIGGALLGTLAAPWLWPYALVAAYAAAAPWLGRRLAISGPSGDAGA